MSTFNCFPDLPTELQIHIYKLASLPTIAQLVATPSSRPDLPEDQYPHVYGRRASLPQYHTWHALMRTCRLASDIGVELWKKNIEEWDKPKEGMSKVLVLVGEEWVWEGSKGERKLRLRMREEWEARMREDKPRRDEAWLPVP